MSQIKYFQKLILVVADWGCSSLFSVIHLLNTETKKEKKKKKKKKIQNNLLFIKSKKLVYLLKAEARMGNKKKVKT